MAVLHDLHFLTPSTALRMGGRLEGVRQTVVKGTEHEKRSASRQQKKKKDKLVLSWGKLGQAQNEHKHDIQYKHLGLT